MLFFNPQLGRRQGASASTWPTRRAARGIEPIELRPGDDLEQLVRDAVADGADGLAMAGGDGSQAIVAAIAAEHDLPYACIPAGTRNHFALDLGVDRDDVVGALDAFVDGGERRVDLAEVNGRVFVNNVSLGLYAEAVQRDRLPRGEAAHAARHACRTCSAPTAAGSTCAGPGPAAGAARGGARSSSPTTATGWAARSARARARGSTSGCWGSRWSGGSRGDGADATTADRGARGASGARRPSRSAPRATCPPASTARPCG